VGTPGIFNFTFKPIMLYIQIIQSKMSLFIISILIPINMLCEATATSGATHHGC